MSTEAWVENNSRYLAASLEWLRLRLKQLLPEEKTTMAVVSVPALAQVSPIAAKSGGLFQRLRDKGPVIVENYVETTIDRKQDSEEQLKAALTEREAAAAVEPMPALLLLAQRLGLSPFERDTLLLCTAMEFDPGIASLCARIHGNPSRNYPTFSLALSAFDEPGWDAVSAQRPLRYARLIEVASAGAPLTSSALRADERIVNFLKGLNIVDDRLASLLEPVAVWDDAALAGSQQVAAESVLERLRTAAAQSSVPVVQLAGIDIGSKLTVAQQVCKTLNRKLYRLTIESLPSDPAEVETLARLWQRESVLLPVALFLDAENLEGAQNDASAALRRFLSQEIGVVFVSVRETPIRLNGASFAIDVEKPTAEEQCSAWVGLIKDTVTESEATGIARALAGQFDLNLSDIRGVVAAALTFTPPDGQLQNALWDACRDLTRPSLDMLAQRLEPKATWDDLVLPDEQMRIMRQIAGQVRERHKVYGEWGFGQKMNRGFGISALFAGESGTGKTMAAEVIANDLRLNLYRIDLSAVVSKYIGETEKNLRKLFDAAEQGGAILFFDEADALFGKRSEVKDSHDRYANIEINYLLQRMESFSGLAILATNMKSSLDQAFMRRLRFIVNFPFPGLKERSLIWQKALPPKMPREALDYERLARLNISGGNIHSIALNAAFMAAQSGAALTMPTMLAAARSELKKLEKPFSEAEFK